MSTRNKSNIISTIILGFVMVVAYACGGGGSKGLKPAGAMSGTYVADATEHVVLLDGSTMDLSGTVEFAVAQNGVAAIAWGTLATVSGDTLTFVDLESHSMFGDGTAPYYTAAITGTMKGTDSTINVTWTLYDDTGAKAGTESAVYVLSNIATAPFSAGGGQAFTDDGEGHIYSAIDGPKESEPGLFYDYSRLAQ